MPDQPPELPENLPEDLRERLEEVLGFWGRPTPPEIYHTVREWWLERMEKGGG